MKNYRCYRPRACAIPKCVVVTLLCIAMLFPIAVAADVQQTSFVASIVGEIKTGLRKTYDPFYEPLGLYQSEVVELEEALSHWKEGIEKVEEYLEGTEYYFSEYTYGGDGICAALTSDFVSVIFRSSDSGASWQVGEEMMDWGRLAGARGKYVLYQRFGEVKEMLISEDNGYSFDHKAPYPGMNVYFQEFTERSGNLCVILNLGTESGHICDVVFNLETFEEEERIVFNSMQNAQYEAMVERKTDIFPDSNSRYLTENDLQNWWDVYDLWDAPGYGTINCDQQLAQIGINEIYARNGFKFDDVQAAEFFEACEWYDKVVPTRVTEKSFNYYERANINFLVYIRDRTSVG